MEQQLLDNYNKNKLKAQTLIERWKKGDKVRVLKNLDVNVCNVQEYLGKVCIVEETIKHVPIFGSEPRIEYRLRLGNRLEPFWEEELDKRFKSNCS